MSITDAILIGNINTSLKDRYRVLDGRPIFRIVWSADQLEVRRGLMREYYGHIFLREYFTTGPRPKYWYFQNPCWVLERLVFISNREALKDICSELVEAANGTYEPVFPFIDKNFNPLPVSRPVVEVVVWKLMNPMKPLTPGQLEDLRLKEDDLETKYFEEQLGADERSPLFVAGNSVNVSTAQLNFKKEYKEK